MKTYIMVLLLVLLSINICAADSIQSVGKNARINWTELYYEADGYAALPNSANAKSKSYLKAKDSAKKNAVANLIMAINATTVNYQADGKDLIPNKNISQQINRIANKVQVTGSYQKTINNRKMLVVKVKAPIFGKNSLAAILIKDDSQKAQPKFMESMDKSMEMEPVESPIKVVLKPDYQVAEEKPQMILKEAGEDTPVDTPNANTGYTGVIIDASGYKLDRALCPKIRRQDGSEVWGTISIDYDLALEKGIVSYASSMEEAKANARAGANPLVIKAIGRAGNKFYSDPVITDDDASLMLEENKQTQFLDQCNVVFIKDPISN